MPVVLAAPQCDAGHAGLVRSAVRRHLDPSAYRFGYDAAGVGILYLWIVLCTAVLDAFADREGPSQYLRWMPEHAGHLITAPTSLLLGKLMVEGGGYQHSQHGLSITSVAASPLFGAGLILCAGLVQAPLIYLLLRGPRRRPNQQEVAPESVW